MSRLPFLFIITGLVGFVLFQAASVITLFDWVGSGLRGPAGWFYVHLFVLGWATMLAMGAVYQLINVILQSSIYSNRLGFTHYVCFTTGLCGLLYGFHTAEIGWIAGSAVLAFAGILMFVWNIAVTLLRAAKWDAITISAASAVGYLLLTGLSGLAMGLNFYFGDWNGLHERLFGAHIWMGTTGWFGLLITGFSYKLLPMFYLSHNYPARLQKAILLIWNSAVIVGAVSFLLDAGFWGIWIALLLITISVIIFNIHILQVKKHRHKRNPGLGIKWSVYGNQGFAVILVVALAAAVCFPDQLLSEKFVMLAGWIYLGGWVSYNILCYASKIVPFLWWTEKYGKMIGKPGTPTMANLLDERKAQTGLIAIAFLLLCLFASIILELPVVIAVSGIALSLCSIAYITLIGLVFKH